MSVPSVPEENGNSKHSPSPKFIWDLVINNWTEEDYKGLFQVCQTLCKKYVIAKEVGESGTPHLQCYLNFKAKMRLTAISKLIPRGSARPARNDEALAKYCMEDGDYVSAGFPKPVWIISELRPWQKEMEDIYNGPIDNRKVHWRWEAKGNVGKSAFVKYMVVKYKALFCDGGKASDLTNLVFNNDMNNCRVIIWDLPRCTKGAISYKVLESVKNGLICNTKYETGVKYFNAPHVFVFANEPPGDVDSLSEDRWDIKEIGLEPT